MQVIRWIVRRRFNYIDGVTIAAVAKSNTIVEAVIIAFIGAAISVALEWAVSCR